jgi:hypothetical protein
MNIGPEMPLYKKKSCRGFVVGYNVPASLDCAVRDRGRIYFLHVLQQMLEMFSMSKNFRTYVYWTFLLIRSEAPLSIMARNLEKIYLTQNSILE